MGNMSEQKKGVHHAIRLRHYSASKDEYLDVEDMAQEHLVNMLYKLVKDGDYLAQFKVEVSAGNEESVSDSVTLKFTDGCGF